MELLRAVREVIIVLRGQDCLVCPGDVGDFEQAHRIFSEIAQRFGGADILVTIAGVSDIGLFQDMSADDWQSLLNTNLSSVFYSSK